MSGTATTTAHAPATPAATAAPAACNLSSVNARIAVITVPDEPHDKSSDVDITSPSFPCLTSLCEQESLVNTTVMNDINVSLLISGVHTATNSDTHSTTVTGGPGAPPHKHMTLYDSDYAVEEDGIVTRFYLPIRLLGLQVEALLDSAAKAMVVSKPLAEMLVALSTQKSRRNAPQLKAVTGDPMRISTHLDVPIQVGDAPAQNVSTPC